MYVMKACNWCLRACGITYMCNDPWEEEVPLNGVPGDVLAWG